MTFEHLSDREFLRNLDEYPHKVTYIKIQSISMDEYLLSEIEGKVMSGTISIDGSSTQRRTCQLSLVSDQKNINNTDWVLNSKFKVFLGLRNVVNPAYDEIVWFPQGTYVLTAFNFNVNAQGYTISVTGKDKICLLDGSIGGSVFATHDFGKIVEADGSYTLYDITSIIREMIHEYANEPYYNIIINDLEDVAVDLISSRANKKSIYLYNIYTNDDSGSYTTQMTAGDEYITPKIDSSNLLERLEYAYLHGAINQTFILNNIKYEFLLKAEYGDTIGYRHTELTYAGDLIAKVGESITSILDKIVQMLGSFEYYYDVEGHFIFQRKKIYHEISFSNELTADTETEDASNNIESTLYYYPPSGASEFSYSFSDNRLLESIADSPQLTNIRNDFTIWGKKTTSSSELPIHMRYAIDTKPDHYQMPCYYDPNSAKIEDTGSQFYYVKEYMGEIPKAAILANKAILVDDWRDILYEMAFARQRKDSQIAFAKKQIIEAKKEYESMTAQAVSEAQKDRAHTRYLESIEKWDKIIYEQEETQRNRYSIYFADILGFWANIHDINQIEHKKPDPSDARYKDKSSLYQADLTTYNNWRDNHFWNPSTIHYEDGKWYIKEPQSLIFWFDFWEVRSDLANYSVSAIGRRPKVINDDKVKSIFYKEIPNVLFVQPGEEYYYGDSTITYARISIPQWLENYISISTRGKSAKDELDNLLYEHTYYADTVTLSGVPLYYLEPNTKIQIYNDEAGIHGEYYIKSISLNLSYEGMMSIQASRVNEEIL